MEEGCDTHDGRPLSTWPRWMRIGTCARYLDRTVAGVRGLVARGTIPFVKQGATVYFDRDVIDAWMRSWDGHVPVAGARPRRKASGGTAPRSPSHQSTRRAPQDR